MKRQKKTRADNLLIVCRLCGQEEPHEARGLGYRCYQKAWRMGLLHRFPSYRAKLPSTSREREYWKVRDARRKEYFRALYARRKARQAS